LRLLKVSGLYGSFSAISDGKGLLKHCTAWINAGDLPWCNGIYFPDGNFSECNRGIG
jgi:hypothetical protein